MPIKPENYRLIRRHFYRLFNYSCAICDQECDNDGFYTDVNGLLSTMEFDHIKPNGTNRHEVSRSVREWEWFQAFEDNNLQLLCKLCNIKKSNK